MTIHFLHAGSRHVALTVATAAWMSSIPSFVDSTPFPTNRRLLLSPSDLDSLDWTGLRNNLTSPDVLTVVYADKLNLWSNECVDIFEAEIFPYVPMALATLQSGSNYQLVDQPLGMCPAILSCAFRFCDLYPTTIDQLNDVDPPISSVADYFAPEAVPQDLWNLPAAVVHPETASDVIAAIQFALSQGIGLSTKTTGHSYTGSSTDANSLQINMRKYPKYLAQSGYLMECDASNHTEGNDNNVNAVEGSLVTTDDLRGQACKVAVARGWSAILRVGGGALFDEAYRSVSEWNRVRSEDTGSGNWTYHLVGGGAGTVGAAGGWMLQTGLSGTSGMRKFGFGVDQVTQMEMVLPTGQHVRFGPTEWQEDPSLAFPRTTKVTGWCNVDPSRPESEWEWEICSEREGVNFDDLWHAVRGGGGGFGVTLSVEYQLPDWPGTTGLLLVVSPPGFDDKLVEQCGECEEEQGAIYLLLFSFFLDALFDPAKVGLSEEESNLCGSPGSGSFYGYLFCFGEGGQIYAAAFARYVEAARPLLIGAGLTVELIDLLPSLTVPDITGKHNDYALFLLSSGGVPGVPSGRLPDEPKPSTAYHFSYTTMLVPRTFINSEEGRGLFFSDPQLLYTTGGASATHHDGTTATSEAYRNSAMYLDLQPRNINLVRGILASHVGDGTPQGSFPPVGEFNHMQDYSFGPLKSNWTEPCPMISETFTRADRKELCISKLEFIFGSEGLERLEAIKAAVDPHHLFNCYGCVGYVEPEGPIPPTPTESPTSGPTDTSGTHSEKSVLLYGVLAAIFSLVVHCVA